MSVFPFINPETASGAADQELPMFREYAYDFEKAELKLDENGKTYLVEGNEALRIWVFFALGTDRFAYAAHSRAYGSEIRKNIIGHALDDLAELELERYITEAVLVNPYIEEVSNFLFERSGNSVTVTFDLLTVYGEDTESFEVKGVF